jgi:hypothetical protein
VLEAELERLTAGEAVELDDQLEVPAPPCRKRSERPIIGVEARGERDGTQARGVAEELAGPGDSRRPREGDRCVDQPTRTGEIGVDQQAAGAERRELDGPGLRATRHVEREIGGRCSLRGAADLEPDVAPDPFPEIAAARAGGPEGIPSPTEHLDPMLDRLGEDGEDEQRDDGHGTPGRMSGEGSQRFRGG